jgi:hypothetical protein
MSCKASVFYFILHRSYFIVSVSSPFVISSGYSTTACAVERERRSEYLA